MKLFSLLVILSACGSSDSSPLVIYDATGGANIPIETFETLTGLKLDVVIKHHAIIPSCIYPTNYNELNTCLDDFLKTVPKNEVNFLIHPSRIIGGIASTACLSGHGVSTYNPDKLEHSQFAILHEWGHMLLGLNHNDSAPNLMSSYYKEPANFIYLDRLCIN